MSQKSRPVIFAITWQSEPSSYFFTVKLRHDLQRKLELKLPPPLKSGAMVN